MNTNVISAVILVIGLLLLGISITKPSITGMATGTTSVTVSNDTSITLTVSTINFGSMSMGDVNDTTDNAPAPFTVRNDGNVAINISASSSDNLWDTQANPTMYYQVRCGNTSEWTGCSSNYNPKNQNTFTNVPTSATQIIWNLTYASSVDEAEIDINVTVPTDEGGGSKSSALTVTSANCFCN